jgi:hypothetical protein
MSKQTKPINAQCQKRLHGREHGRCVNAATHGVYAWGAGETDVNLDRPVIVVCGAHKPQLDNRYHNRIVRLRTK